MDFDGFYLKKLIIMDHLGNSNRRSQESIINDYNPWAVGARRNAKTLAAACSGLHFNKNVFCKSLISRNNTTFREKKMKYVSGISITVNQSRINLESSF